MIILASAIACRVSPSIPFLHPGSAFEANDYSIERALAVVGVVGLISALALAGFGVVLQSTIPSTVTVENPDRPPASACDDDRLGGNMTVDGENITFGTPEACAEARQIPAQRLVWRVLGPRLPFEFLSAFVSWFVVGGTFHVFTRTDDESARGPLVVTAWGTVPQAIGTVLTVTVLSVSVLLGSAPVAASFEASLQRLETAVRASISIAFTITAGMTLWSGWIHYHGLRAVRELDRRQALEAVSLVAAAGLLLSLWSLLSL